MTDEISNVEIDFITPLSIHYSVKHEDDAAKKLWREDYVDALKGFAPDVLREAAKRIMRKRNWSNFPLIADCLDACKSVLDDRNAGKPPEVGSHKGYPEWSHERQRRADEMIRSPLGQKAASEGWIIGLWDFCRNRERLPQHYETAKIITSSREARAAMDQIDPKNAVAPALLKLRDTLNARREELSDMVLHGVVRR